MTSSYSRPGTRQTARANRAARPNRVRVQNLAGQQQAGRYRIDSSFVDPGQAGRNAEQQYKEINQFLSTAAEVVQPLLEQQDIADANRQVGELIKNNPGLPDLFREAPEEAQDKIRSLSPRAKDLYLQDLAKGQVYEYSQSFPAAVEADALLQQPTTPENQEAQARRFTELQSQSMQGVMALPAGYVAGVSPELQQVEGTVRGGLEKSRLQKQAKLDSMTQSSAIAADLEIAAAESIGGNANPEVEAFAGPLVVDEANKRLRDRIESNIRSGRFTEEQTYRDLRNGIQMKINALLNDGEYEEAESLLDLV